MKILLIEPRGVSQYLHSGLAYLASALANDNQVKVFDLNFLNLSEAELNEKIIEENPDLVGISIKSANAKKALALAELVRSVSKSILVCGGPHITLCGLNFFNQEAHGLFDFGFSGETEISFPSFCQAINQKTNYEAIAGLIFLKDGSWQQNQPGFVNDLNTLSFPDFSVFAGVNLSNLSYPLLTSRGCPYSCIYCSVNKVSGRKWRFRSPQNIVDELKAAKEKYRFNDFKIMDDNFTLDQQRAIDFCQILEKENLGLRWGCPNGIRADKLDAPTIAAMKRAGCESVSLGIESGDPTVFARIKKGEVLEDIKKAAELLKAGGIKVNGFFIVGLPGDSIGATRKSVEFINQLKLNGTKWNFLIPYPQTELWDWVSQNGKFLADFTEGKHFSRNNENIIPVFETNDFSARQRIRAYKIANLATGNYSYVFKKPKNRLYFYFKLFFYFLYYTPETLVKKIRKRLFKSSS